MLALAAQLAALGGIALLIARGTRSEASHSRRLERVIRDNHKKASEWEWRLSKALRGYAAAVKTATQSKPSPKPASAPPPKQVSPAAAWKNHPLTDELLASGYFDGAYYRAVAVARFARDFDAASHYLSVGLRKLESPSPFLEVASLPAAVTTAMKNGEPDALLAFLRSREAMDRPLGDWFDPRELDLTRAAMRRHPGGPLGLFASTMDEATVLPVPASSPHHGTRAANARQVLLEHAVRVGETRRLAGSREQASWDADAERRWLADLAEATVDMEEPPLVSVIMPVRDRAGVVGQAIASVRRQSYTRWQLLIVDDGSIDGTYEVIAAAAALDERVVVLRNPGAGVSSARNAGLAAASGEYVAFLDSDNEWLPAFLETMVRGMRRASLRAAYSAAAVTRAGGAETYRAFVGGIDHLLMLNHIDLNVLVVEAAVARQAGGFDEDLRRWVDHDFAIRVGRVFEPELLPFIGCQYDHSSESSDRITVRESDHWQWVALGKNWVDWCEVERAERVPGRVSVIIPTYGDSSMTIAAARSVLADDSHDDVEVVIVDNGSNVQVGQAILKAMVGERRARYVRLPRNLNFAIGCNYGVAASTGEMLLFLNNDTLVRPGALAPLVHRLRRPGVLGVQPLLQYPDDTIQTAGTVFIAPDAPPCHFLVGHPATDADRVGTLRFGAVTAAALLVRAADVVALRGFDPIFVNGMEDVDLCLRAAQSRGGWFEVEPKSQVTHFESKTPGRSKNIGENRRLFMERWAGRLPSPQPQHYEAVGFELAHVASDYNTIPAPRPIIVRARSTTALRWSLKISSIPGPRGDMWGDTHFAESLRRALERAGQSVAIYRHSSHEVAATAFDDVVLSLRGLTRVKPMPGKVNVLWVISHPEMVTEGEIAEFDLVFAASMSWAARMTAETGRTVHPLLQATDTTRFNTSVPAVEQKGAVFVGGCPPNRPRPIVFDAITAGVPMAVYGPGWEGNIPDELLGGSYVENDQLCGVYRGSTRVLADHWRDMAAEGFLQNRLFDAVAAGCRVVSDVVPDVDTIFRGAVQVYRSSDDLARLCGEAGDAFFPGDDDMEAIARLVAEEHSFDRRAQQLIEAVEGLG